VCSQDRFAIDDEKTLRKFFGSPQLQALRVRETFVTDQIFVDMLRSFAGLATLELWDVDVSVGALSQLHTLVPNLRALRLRQVCGEIGMDVFNPSLVCRLEELVLVGVTWVNDKCLESFALANSLRVLCVRGNSLVGTNCMIAVTVAAGLALNELELSSCACASDELCASLERHNQRLTRLALHDANVSDASMCTLVKHLTQLQSLDLSLTGVSCDSLRALAVAPCVSHLRVLNISQLYNVTKDGVEDFLGNASALRELYMAENDEVDDDTMLLLTSSCTELQRLDISQCHEVSIMYVLFSLVLNQILGYGRWPLSSYCRFGSIVCC
jgi:hypothetical protein